MKPNVLIYYTNQELTTPHTKLAEDVFICGLCGAENQPRPKVKKCPNCGGSTNKGYCKRCGEMVR